MLSVPTRRVPAQAGRGFTLIEMVIVTTLAALLATLSYPSVADAVRRVHRTDALAALTTVQLLQQRHRSSHPQFASLERLGVAAELPGGRYRLELSQLAADGYVLTALAQGSQAHDTPCRHLRIEVAGADVYRSSGPDAQSGNPAPQNRRCWGF